MRFLSLMILASSSIVLSGCDAIDVAINPGHHLYGTWACDKTTMTFDRDGNYIFKTTSTEVRGKFTLAPPGDKKILAGIIYSPAEHRLTQYNEFAEYADRQIVLQRGADQLFCQPA